MIGWCSATSGASAAPAVAPWWYVQGRTSEIIRLVDGTEVHPVLFSTAIGANRGVADYQVRQRGEVLEVSVVPAGRLEAGSVVVVLERHLRDAGAPPGTVVAVRVVDEVPRHPVTGKAARVVPDRSLAVPVV